MVLVVDPTGKILESNQAVFSSLGLGRGEVNGANVGAILDIKDLVLFPKILDALEKEEPTVFESEIIRKNSTPIVGLFTCCRINYCGNAGYLISIRDITSQKINEQMLLKAIIEAQHNEQRRVADQLHDSIGQELSMAKLMITNLNTFHSQDPKGRKLVKVCEEILDGSVSHLREICFNLMPGVLENSGLGKAITDLVNRLNSLDKIKVLLQIAPNFPRLHRNLELVMFRIVQEFINNMIKHSIATELRVKLIVDSKDGVVLDLSENGQGFDVASLEKSGNQRGYRNINSNILAYGGEMTLKSSKKGINLKATFPQMPPDEKT